MVKKINEIFQKIKKILPLILVVSFLVFLFFYSTDKNSVKIGEPEEFHTNTDSVVNPSFQSDGGGLPETLSEIQNAWNDLNLPVGLQITKDGLGSFKYLVISKGAPGNITDIWRGLSIQSDLCFCEYYEDDESYADKNNYCKACDNINSVELVGAAENRDYKIFRYQFDFSDYQYLVFGKNSDSRWEFLGNIDLGGQKYGPPTYRIVEKRKENWLVIDTLGGSGTGIANYIQRWYWLGKNKDDGIIESLNYPIEGHLFGPGLPFNKEYFSKEILIGGGDLNIVFYAFYTNSRKDIVEDLDELFFIQKNAVYDWDIVSKYFVLNREKSQITQVQVEGIYLDGNDGFLKHNFRELQKLADSKNSSVRKWLNFFLNETEDSPEKKLLLKKIES